MKVTLHAQMIGSVWQAGVQRRMKQALSGLAEAHEGPAYISHTFDVFLRLFSYVVFMPIDQHGALEEQPFSYKAHSDGKLFVYYEGKHVRTYPDPQASKMLKQLEKASPEQQQLLLAKATGNFKRGNERKKSRS
jgi:hypothetical protein